MSEMNDNDTKAAFERDGFVVLRGLVSGSDCEKLQAIVAAICGGERTDVTPQHWHSRQGSLTMTKLNQLTEIVPEFMELARSRALVDVVEQLIGPRSHIFRDVVVVKPGPTPGVLRHHQDSAYWDVEPKHLVSAWVALSDAPSAAGPLSVVPGTHRSPVAHDISLGEHLTLPRPVTRFLRGLVSLAGTGDNPATTSGGTCLTKLKRAVLAGESSFARLLDGLQDYHVRNVDATRCEILGASRGDVVFFHSLLIHGTGPNLTTHDRTVSIISYMPEGARLPKVDAGTLPLARISG